MKKLLFVALTLLIGGNIMAQTADELKRDGNIKQNEKNYNEALVAYEKYNAADAAVAGADNETTYNMGFCAYKSKDYTKTVKYFNTCIEKGHKTAKAYDYIAKSYMSSKDYKNALVSYEKLYALDEAAGEENSANLYNMASCSYKTKDYTKATKYFSKCTEAGYKGEMSYLYLATSYKQLKDTDSYIAKLEEGVAKYPNSAKLKKAASQYYSKIGKSKFDEGTKIFNSAIANVQAGKYTTADEAYKTELKRAIKSCSEAKPSIDKAIEILPTSKSATAIKSAIDQTVTAINTSLKG